MIRIALAAALFLLPCVALAGGWEVYGPDGVYRGRIERGSDGTLERFGPDGAYQGRISGEGERGAGRGEIDR